MIDAPELTKAMADDIARTASLQLTMSRQFKYPRMKEIAESENLYYGVVKKTIKNPFNESFPYMSGFVDTLMSEVDDPPTVELEHKDEADYKAAKKYESFIGQEMQSPTPNAQWALKDRWCKKFAIFSGFGVYCLYAETYEGNFTMSLEVIDYYDFHCEPAGGGDLENHIFCGRENIFKTEEQLLEGAKAERYDEMQVQELIAGSSGSVYKENEDELNLRINRYRAMGLDPITSNYTGQTLYKLVEWYLTYKGVRYYCLFDPKTKIWVRVKALREMFKPIPQTGEALWPFVAWHTSEDARLFYSKAPADDARPIGITINRLLNQELYNREKKNTGKFAYDPNMFFDTEALHSWRPDEGVPFDSKGGTRAPGQGYMKFQQGDLNSSIDLVGFLDGFGGQKTGTTPGSQGSAPKDQKVGIFFGELKQIQGRMGLMNKSYKGAWQQLIYRAIMLIDDQLSAPIAIQMLGAAGIEWDELTPEDKQRVRDFGIQIKGAGDQMIEEQQKGARKMEALKLATATNPKWKDIQMLKAAGFTSEDLKNAFTDVPMGTEELMSEAKQAVDKISKGKKMPELNQSANLAFVQRCSDLALEINDEDIQANIYDYITAHSEIVSRNEIRLITAARMAQAMAALNPTPVAPGAPMPGAIPSPLQPGDVTPAINNTVPPNPPML